MSKINAVRLINLNYNNNSIRISDETFDFNGKNTLLSLRNGGGKSVLVQVLSAPFVHKKFRNTKDRAFENYFTSSKPTFIMIEWKLDQGAGYCLTGMMVRRNQASDEQNAEALEIINFVSEYTSRCPHDIHSIPVVEKTKRELILKNFSACKQLFETYKKENTKKFFYYDMNNSAQSRQYFDKLAEYKIYYKEWETIMHEINLKESGLSELFSDCKNEKELIEKWFLKTIENKLNNEHNRMKEFQTIIEKYVSMYKDNKSKIERKNTILKFKEDMLDIDEKANLYMLAEQNVKHDENRIANFIYKLKELEASAFELQQEKINKNQLYEKNILYILYEKLSMEIHKQTDELEYHIGNRDMIQMEKDSIESDMEKIEKCIHIYDCAKQQELVDEQEQDYELIIQKIDISRKNEQELEPERIQIGGYLKHYYNNCVLEKELLKEVKEKEYFEIEQKCNNQKIKLEELQTNIEELIEKITACKTKINAFDTEEDKFNQSYGESFVRNILGEYEPGMIEIKQKQYEKQLSEINRAYNNHIKQQHENEEKKKICERNKEDKNNQKRDMQIELNRLEREYDDFENQIKTRKIIMRYLAADEDMLWNSEKLLELLDRKLLDIENSRRELEKDENILQNEWKKLTSGEILELPQDFKDLIDELELHPISGMSWLERNGNNAKENAELVRRQPFIPYSMILPRDEIVKLETYGKSIFTSFPIPIIERETLADTISKKDSRILRLSGVCFYLWFNDKLLDEEALKILIKQKENEIQNKKKQIESKRIEYQDYSDRKSIINNQTLTKAAYDKNKDNQNEIKESIEKNNKAVYELTEEILSLNKAIEELIQIVLKDREGIEWSKRRNEDFERFMERYNSYKQDKQDKLHYSKDKERYEDSKKQAKALQEKLIEKLESLKHTKYELDNLIKALKDKLLNYEAYEVIDSSNTEKTPEEMEARYYAITSKMSTEIQDLELQQQKIRKKLTKAKDELQRLKKKYFLTENEWLNISYNEQEYLHQEKIFQNKQHQIKEKEYEWNDVDKKIAVLENQINQKKEDMLKQCGHNEPLAKNEIKTVDFESEMNQLRYKISELGKEIKNIEKYLQSLSENLTAFAEYSNLEIFDVIEWEQNFSEMEPLQLRDFSGIIRRDYKNNKEEHKNKKDKLEASLNMLLRKEDYQEDYYRKPLEAMLSVTEQSQLVLEQLSTTIQSYDSQMAKLAVDIAMVEKEKLRIEGLIENYIKDVHNNMAKIDNNSTITIREKPIKMLRLQIPDWNENEGLYRQRLSDFMDELTKNGIQIYELNENASDYFSSRITTKNVYDTIIGIGNIQIKLYKIEEQREYPITWAEVARNSGGEGFLSAFVILSSLMHYMRRDDTDIFADRNEGKVLIMDNPFAQTNASHLLKPLMDVARKTNTQLICLSGLGGDSIYGRFDNIYVLNLVAASLFGGVQYLRGEHTRGGAANEETIVASHIEVLEQQSLLF